MEIYTRTTAKSRFPQTFSETRRNLIAEWFQVTLNGSWMKVVSKPLRLETDLFFITIILFTTKKANQIIYIQLLNRSLSHLISVVIFTLPTDSLKNLVPSNELIKVELLLWKI